MMRVAALIIPILLAYLIPSALGYQYTANETVKSMMYSFHASDLYNVTITHSISPDPPVAGQKVILHIEFLRYLPIMPVTKTYHPTTGTVQLLPPKLQNTTVNNIEYVVKDFIITNFTSTSNTATLIQHSKILAVGSTENGTANIPVTFDEPGKHFVIVHIDGINHIPTSIMKNFEHPTFEQLVMPTGWSAEAKVPEFGLQSAIMLAVSIGVIVLVTQRTNLRLK